ncbi:hypothetical protein FACS18945_1050 [Bacteroidia bacterium]|nr:hypothetical protein FACS18945_1050 [Bacteroidia bacterium]
MIAAQVFYFNPELIKSIVLFIAPYLPDRLSHNAVMYMTSYFAKRTEFGTGLFYLGQMMLSIFVVVFIKPKDDKAAFFLNTLAVFVIIKGFAIGLEIIGRLEPYYLVYAIIAYTYLFDIQFKRLKSVYVICACVLLLFFAAPYIRGIMKTDTDALTGRPANYAIVPYYNVLSHPPEATTRKDWFEE